MEAAPHRYNMEPLCCPTMQWATGIFESCNLDVLLAFPAPNLQFALPPAVRQHFAQAFIIWG